MPTYENSTSKIVPIAGGDIRFGPNEVKEIYSYIDLTSDEQEYITKTSDLPSFNPIGQVHSLTSDTPSAGISNWETTDAVEIYNASSNLITMFLNDTDNTDGIIIPAGTVRYVRDIGGKVQTLHFTYGGVVNSGEAYVTEIKNSNLVELKNI